MFPRASAQGLIEKGRGVGNRSLVISYLPRAGFGNKLFIWARGQVFAEARKLRHLHFPWTHISLGAIARHRNPWYGCSINSTSLSDLGSLLMSIGNHVIVEPDIECRVDARNSVSYVFYRNADWHDYFFQLREHRQLLRRAFLDLLSDSVKLKARVERPCVAIHVRTGDFQALDKTKPFEEQGLTRAPLAYFREIIEAFQQDKDLCALPIWLFSDGVDMELRELLDIPGVRRWRSGNDILDLVVMSQSKILITAPSSTYSMWAAFLGDSIVVHHPAHFHKPVRQVGDGIEVCWGTFGVTEVVASHLSRNPA
jgi:hypothetical protein